MNIDTDEQLVKRYLSGKDDRALEVLVKRYLPLIYGFARKYTGNPDNAADIAQDVFVKVWKNLNRFDDTKSFRTWIFTIAKNTSLDWLKKKKPLPFSALEGGDEFIEKITDGTVSVSDLVSSSMSSKQLEVAIDKLPINYRNTLRYRLQHDMSFSEISDSLKEPLNTVKSKYRRGIALLRNILKK